MSPYFIAILILGILVIFLMYMIFNLGKRVDKLLRGKHAKDLEETIHTLTKELETIYTRLEQHNNTLRNHDNRIGKTIKDVPTLRFNPFYDSGGNQSFASAFVTEEGNGVVISSLYSREKTSVFAKPIKNFQSTFELTEEERNVLDQARKQND